jgi:hypothetical protein
VGWGERDRTGAYEARGITMRHCFLPLLLTLSVEQPAFPEEAPFTAELELVNAHMGSFDKQRPCYQEYIAWTLEPPLESTSPYILVKYEPSDGDEGCITEQQAQSGGIVVAKLTRNEACDSWGEHFSTWGFAEQECINLKGWASDCWEERSSFIPLGDRGLSLKEIDDLFFQCYSLEANPFLPPASDADELQQGVEPTRLQRARGSSIVLQP